MVLPKKRLLPNTNHNILQIVQARFVRQEKERTAMPNREHFKAAHTLFAAAALAALVVTNTAAAATVFVPEERFPAKWDTSTRHHSRVCFLSPTLHTHPHTRRRAETAQRHTNGCVWPVPMKTGRSAGTIYLALASV